MKKLLFILALTFLSFESEAQAWCAPGATWVFRIQNSANPWVSGFIQVKNKGIISTNGKVCNLISGSRYGVWGDPVAPQYSLGGSVELSTYMDNDVMYYMLSQLNSNFFDTLANFKAKIGEGWYIKAGWDSSQCRQLNITKQKLLVVDTGHIIINGFNLKKLIVSTNTLIPGGYLILERIGPLSGYFYRHYCCYIDCWDQLGDFSCYTDDLFPVYSVGSAANCNFVGIRENFLHELNFRIFPNPGIGLFTYQIFEPAKIEVDDAAGRVLYNELVKDADQHSLDLHDFPDGMYFIKVQGPSGCTYSKLVKAQN